MKYIDLLAIEGQEIHPKKISMHEIYMNLARMLALKSTCHRGQNGCVVTQHGRIISTGYNGSPDQAEECISRPECRQQGTKVIVPMGSVYQQPKEFEIKKENT